MTIKANAQKTKTILDLCGGTGAWSEPYLRAGFHVIVIDPSDNIETTAEHWKADIRDVDLSRFDGLNVYGVLAAPPCTHFTVSGAQYWKAKDEDGRTADHMRIVEACLSIIEYTHPVFWVLENPVGRLPRLFPERLGKPKMYIQPYEYGDPYSKKTALWGDFSTPEKDEVEPVWKTASNGDRYSPIMMATGGKSAKTKKLRSKTPAGFAEKFFEANS